MEDLELIYNHAITLLALGRLEVQPELLGLLDDERRRLFLLVWRVSVLAEDALHRHSHPSPHALLLLPVDAGVHLDRLRKVPRDSAKDVVAEDGDGAVVRPQRAAEELKNGHAPQALVAVTSESGSEPPSCAESAGDAGDPGPALRTDTPDPALVGATVHPPHSPASSAQPKPAASIVIEHTEAQEKALDAISSWLDQGDEQVFRLFGCADTGKTTLAREIARRYPPGQVLLAAYTGKALMGKSPPPSSTAPRPAVSARRPRIGSLP
jgi:hypothetical protein